MKISIIYFWYLVKSIIKSNLFIICSVLYYALMIIVMFGLPKFLNITIFDVYNNKMIIMAENTIIIILAIGITVKLFKKMMTDGSELIILSKVITRTKIAWIKIITTLVIALLLSGVLTLISLFLLINNSIKMVGGIIIGSFIGPLTTILFWSALTLVGAIIFKNSTTLFISMVCLIGVTTAISNLVDLKIKTVKQSLDEFKITTKNVQLFNELKTSEFDEYVVSYYNGVLIDDTTKINNINLDKLGLEPKTILPYYYNKFLHENQILVWGYLDMWELTSALFNIHFNDNYWPSSQYLNDESSEWWPRSIISKYTPTSGDILNDKDNIVINGEKWYLTGNNIQPSIIQNNNLKQIILPTLVMMGDNFQTVTLENNEELGIKFAKEYLSKETKEKINNVYEQIGSISGTNNKAIGYIDLIASYLLTNLKTNIIGMAKNQSYNNEVTKMIMNFQYCAFTTYNDFLKNPSKYKSFDGIEEELMAILEIGNSNINMLNIDANNYIKLLNKQSNLSIDYLKNTSLNKTLPLKLMKEKQLSSLDYTKLTSIYDYNILVPVCIIGVMALNIVFANMLMQKDQY